MPGTTVGAYAIERIAGRGGMAVVFEARHRVLDKRVALKMLLPHYAAESETARRFTREGASAARLNHPHAVDVTDVGRDDAGAPFLVMEFLEGEDLATLIEHTGKLRVEQTADILVPVIAALAAAHDLGIVHRDLKPQNIMLAQRRHELVPKVVDFGISKVLEESIQLTGTQALLGTPKYMSPEQAHGAGRVDARSDQFALGSVLYECLTGQAAFDAPTIYAVIAQVVECRFKRPREVAPELPKPLEALIMRALRKNPNERFASMRTLGAALLPFASMRVQLSFAAELDAKGAPPRAASRGPVEPPRDSDSRSAVSAVSQTLPVARTWLRASPRRAWGVAALGAFAAVAGVAVPVTLIAMREQESSARAVVAEPRLPEPAPAASANTQVEQVKPTPPHSDPPAAEPEPPTRVERATYQVDLAVEPATAWFSLDGKPVRGRGRMRDKLPADGAEHVLVVGAAGYRQRTLRFKDAPPPETLVLEKAKGANDALILR